ncbi:MAG: hypothetical protein V5A43_00180 [Haloarculaceae archaeon]
MEPPDRGTGFVISGVVLIVFTIAGSALLAPGIATPGAGNETLVGIHGGGTGWHDEGSVYLLNGSSEVWREDTANSYFEVTELANGSVMAGYMDGGYEDCGPYESPCSRTGFRVIDPEPDPEVTSEYSFPVRTVKNSEAHAAKPLPDGGVLVGDMEEERVFVLEDGEIAWQWNASSFYDKPIDVTETDWLHLNDVDVLSPDRYLVSIRNANQLLILERGVGVVEVINEDRDDTDDAACTHDGQLADTDGDGDVRCGNKSVLNHQHNPHWLGEGAVLVADSHNDRIVELRNRSGIWEPVWSLESAGGVRFDWPRDADRLPNGNTLITDTLNRRIVEVNDTGHVVWSYETTDVPYEADRVPVGERTPAPTFDGNMTDPIADPPGDIPVLSLGLVGLKSLFPGVPYWFNELQLFLVLAGIGTMVVGSGLRYRSG